ncbi:MAG: TadE/TadG family type IV pilus assembly protein [Devosia sp.]
MRRLVHHFKRFQNDERGAFMVLFGVLAVVLIATAGAVVDFTAVQQARTRGQTALDSASLALQARISLDTNAQLKTKATTILQERLNDATITASVSLVETNTTEGSIKLTASITKPTAFVALIGIPSITAQLVSQATRKQLDLEVAMVLDNSGSMSTNSRMTNLKLAARCATDILFNAITDCSAATLTASDGLAPTVANVKIGISPFNEFVNVGTGYKTASWMDQTGATKVAKDGFDNDNYDGNAFSTAVNRFTLYTNIGVAWEGCVEARNHTTGAGGLYYDTSDLTPSVGTADSLFTPIFAQDQADGFDNSYLSDTPAACPLEPKYIWTQTKFSCNKDATKSQSNYDSAVCDGASPTNVYTQVSETGVTTTVTSTRPSSIYNNPDPGAGVYVDSYATTSGSGSNRTNRRIRTWTYQYTARELHERICKYVAGNAVFSPLAGGPGGMTGPNADCGVAMQPLTATKSSIISKIAAMNSAGGTNIHQGVVWGFHMLSPTEPLTEGKAFAGTTSKVMIVMTDGENTHSWTSDYAGADWYTAYGYPYQGRLAGANNTALQTEMDNRTKTTCTNAKAKDIVIYTIGLSAPNQTTIDMLTACATDPTKAFFPNTATDLVATFRTIANQLADLRLAL